MNETSIGKIYIAAVVPSIIVCALFFLVILVHGLRQRSVETPPKATAQEKLRSFADLGPTTLLILIVLGTMHGGVATPTEAAALGVVAARVFALVSGKLGFRLLHASAKVTTRNTAMLGLTSTCSTTSWFSCRAANACRHGGRAPAAGSMLVIIGFYLSLGTFMEASP
jgi:C4-dicarboxylate transporter DctM subunit